MNNYIEIIRTIPSFIFYYEINNKFNRYQSKKIALNSLSLCHASISTLLGFCIYLFKFNNNYIQINTGGYLIFDLYYMFMIGKYDLLRIMYIYHHITCYLYMLLPSINFYWPQIVFFSELSNIPNYLVYYSIKNDEKLNLGKNFRSNLTKNLLKVQLFYYAFFRIFVIGYYGILEISSENYIPIEIYMTSILYIFGLIWFGFMLKQNL
jgi:hypothetical protein